MKLVILDRDGVINEDSDDYIKSVSEWQPVPGSIEAIARLTQAGWRVFVATNQSGVGRGMMDFDALFAIHDRMQRACAELGGRIDGIEFAPEHPDHATVMRKPNPGMLQDLARRLQLQLDGVPFVGDSISDVEAAQASGATPILVRSGKGRRTETEHCLDGVAVYDDLAQFVSTWLAA
ncbi:MAG: family hydrolase [Hydrocarboniphaga sp.]|uniref:D-glycero-beta-D-manno-heptose 1,7-bisphosphate 7-phosphatase n=1 Tax=Hydrocarboniphaga sp. TaxID=2033016 RepID=UPI00262E97C9|nr:D-glycero-beta-D-manno-heptose 1,7-bisphosphate 7-phosphatase [Hydrocarboniphaga sp.]MDB5968568.1 family hydrolase [Hydrocarboniphaga sp.]